MTNIKGHLKRWLPVAGFAFAVGICGFIVQRFWFGTSAEPVAAREPAPATAPLPDPHVFAGGIVEGAHRELTLRFEVPGRIKAVNAHSGDTVKAGDVLAELETDVAELNLAEARLRLKVAMAERDQLLAEARQLVREKARDKVPAMEKQVREAEWLIEKNQNSGRQDATGRKEQAQLQQKRDRTVAQLQSLRTQVESPESQLTREEEIIVEGKVALAEAALRRERLLLEKHRLRAPIEGIVLRATFEPGELTGPADEGALLTLVNRDTINVRAFVEELDALRVHPGQHATVTAAGSRGRTYPGIVRTCSPDVHPKSHRHLKPGERLDVRVREIVIELEYGADLLIGLPVEVLIEPLPQTAAADGS